MKIIYLTKENINKYVQRLIDIDGTYSSLESGKYSREIWSEENFMRDLPGKWENSFVVVDENIICAFAICSKSDSKTLHIHRLAVCSEYKGGIASNMLMSAIEGGVQADRITLIVSTENVSAVHYYRRHGFEIISGDELDFFIYKREIHAYHVGDDYYIDNSIYRDSHYVMCKKVGEEYEKKGDFTRRIRLSDDSS